MSTGEVTRIQLCGQFAVIVDGRRVDAQLPGRRGRLLVGYLAVHRQRPVTRAELLDALWPDGGGDAASATLTVLLSKVRAQLGHDVVVGRSGLQLVLPADAIVDAEAAVTALHMAESAIALGRWQRAWAPALAAQFAAGRSFLAGYDEAWIADERARLDLVYEHALVCYAEACLGVGGTELPGAERAARRLVTRAPLSEVSHRLLIRALAARGDVSSALRAYEQLRRMLADELGIDPSPQTRELYQQLLQTSSV